MTAKPELRVEILDILKIRTDGGTQGRVNINPSVVGEYAELMRSGIEFPPVRTWFDGNYYWLVDGFHRIAAARQIGFQRIAAEVLRGSLEDARWDSYGTNASHGVRRTMADIEAVMTQALAHPRSTQLSNNQIARHLQLPETTFRRWKKRLSSSRGEDTMRLAVREGTVYRMQTARIGRDSDAHGPRANSRKQLEEDLDEMKSSASPEARRMLNILGNWICRHSSGVSTLAAIEHLIIDFGRASAKSKQ
jgi:hypothetical protein